MTKNGFTTGSCAAAAAKAAAIMILGKKHVDHVSIITPSGARFDTPLDEVMLTKKDGLYSASCAVRKPQSDDPDVTAGMLIYAKAEPAGECFPEGHVIIEGGPGIGKITKPGLDRPVGDWAINSVPRAMIEREVASVMDEYEYTGSLKITIYAPEGEKIASKTFNPRLGIEGGISIIGTSGIVEPMSTKAIVDTIRVELNQHHDLGREVAVVSPGNWGRDFLKEEYGYDIDKAVKCSNFIGDTIDIAKSVGFRKMILVGHIGKLIKVSGGIWNTHSSVSDRRMELMAEAAGNAGAGNDTISRILASLSTEEAYAVMLDAHIEKKCMSHIMKCIEDNLKERSDPMETACVMYSGKYGILGVTGNIDELSGKGRS